MAHIIAESPDGPRGVPNGGSNSYDNLILLCPIHHRLVDKSPEGFFTVAELKRWKVEHESDVRSKLGQENYKSPAAACSKIFQLLATNKTLWGQYGPESEIARENPLSNAALYWDLRKLDTIVPNNARIVNILKANADLFQVDDYECFSKFEIHSAGFERNCYVRTEGVPTFPKCFEEVVVNYARKK
jgi:hypothetical protein